VKLIKRLGYGRAKLDLLGQRIVHRLMRVLKPGTLRREVGSQIAA